MSNMLLRLMREAGIVKGMVLTFRRQRTAYSAAANMPGKAVVHVPESPICGEYWLMDSADAARINVKKGYTVLTDGKPSPTDAAGGDVR